MIFPGGILAIILLIVICETTAISCVKKYHNSDGSQFLILAVLCYALVCILLNYSLDYKDNVGMVNVIWSGISVFAVVLAGIIFFHEKIHMHDIIAGALVTTGIVIFKYTE